MALSAGTNLPERIRRLTSQQLQPKAKMPAVQAFAASCDAGTDLQVDFSEDS